MKEILKKKRYMNIGTEKKEEGLRDVSIKVKRRQTSIF